MLNEIKCSYLLKVIASYLNEERKLYIALYNKNLQKLFDIYIINYMLYSGRYKIGEKNGIGQEYDYNDQLIFEGEYFNGKRNGKGKVYNSEGDLIFEGEYLNGKKKRKGQRIYKRTGHF